MIGLLVCVAGGLGAALRLVLDGLIRSRVPSTYPLATTVINLSGSLLLGLLAGLAAGQLLSHQWQLVAGTGLLGGYTTFSTASFETVRLIEDRRYIAAAFNGLGMLVAATALAAGGLSPGWHWPDNRCSVPMTPSAAAEGKVNTGTPVLRRLRFLRGRCIAIP